MSVSMIQALPSIHGSLLGIGFALFAAYAIYAYQKLSESKKLLGGVLSRAKSFTSLSSPESPGEATLLDAKGILDWEKVERVLINLDILANSEFQFRVEGGRQHNEEMEFVTLYEQLMQLIDYFFISYPFCGTLHFEGQPSLALIKKCRSDEFNILRIEKMAERVRRLKKNWSIYKSSYVAIARRYSEYKFSKRNKELDEHIIAGLRNMKGYHPQDIEDQINAYMAKPKEFTDCDDYSKRLVEFFQKVFRFSDEVLPDMQEVVVDYHRYRDDFNFTVTCRIALVVFAVVFILGIVVPLVLADVAPVLNFQWVGYILTGVSILPYFYVWVRLWRTVSKSKF